MYNSTQKREKFPLKISASKGLITPNHLYIYDLMLVHVT